MLGCLVVQKEVQAQTVHVYYKKFIVPGNTEYGRWMRGPEMKRKMREQEEIMANSVSEYYDLYSNGRVSFFDYDTLIKTMEITEGNPWWSRMGEAKMSYAKDLRSGEVTIRSNVMPDSVCSGHNYKEKYNWVRGEGMKVFANLKCEQLRYINEEGDSTIVWFTPSIPIADGPDDFGGAPGLILAVEAPNFNYIAEKVELGDFPIEKQPLDLSNCIDEEAFRKQLRDEMIKKYINRKD